MNLSPNAQKLVELASDESLPQAAAVHLLEVIDALDNADTRNARDRAEALEAARGQVVGLAGLLRAGSVRQG